MTRLVPAATVTPCNLPGPHAPHVLGNSNVCMGLRQDPTPEWEDLPYPEGWGPIPGFPALGMRRGISKDGTPYLDIRGSVRAEPGYELPVLLYRIPVGFRPKPGHYHETDCENTFYKHYEVTAEGDYIIHEEWWGEPPAQDYFCGAGYCDDPACVGEHPMEPEMITGYHYGD